MSLFQKIIFTSKEIYGVSSFCWHDYKLLTKMKQQVNRIDFAHISSIFLISVPTYLKFELANKTLANSDVYKSCQQKLLIAEIIKTTIKNY